MCINVDFPEPDGPMMATNSPRLIVREMPFTADTVVSPIRYSRRMLDSSIIGTTAPGAGRTA